MKRRPAGGSQLPLLAATERDPLRDVGQVQFRPIHYLGSKLRLLSPILEAIGEVRRRPGPVVDLFAGSGTVSLALAAEHDVIAVDIQEYSRVLCSAVLAAPAVPAGRASALAGAASASRLHRELARALAPALRHESRCLDAAAGGDLEPLCELVECASLLEPVGDGRVPARPRRKPREQHPGHRAPSTSWCRLGAPLLAVLRESRSRLEAAGLEAAAGSLVTRYFGGPYFSFAQALALDALLEQVHLLTQPEKDYFLAVVLSTASEVVDTVGKQFAQPIRPRDARGRPKAHLARQIIRDRSRSVLDTFVEWGARYHALPRSSHRHASARLDYRDFLASCSRDVSAVYADPPYTRDHYSRYYHVLETLCLRDNPRVSTMRVEDRELPSRGLYREGRHQSPFCIKSQAPGAFDQLFEGVARLAVPLVLSYSPYQADEKGRPRLLLVEDLAALARRRFRRVEVRSVGRFAHNKLNHQALNSRVFHESEVLVVCTSPRA